MGILDETRFIERQRFFDGQRLFASDLQGIEAFNREMRWLHNRSLHQPGIGKGFAVSGQRGDREVRIGPGYALDGLGREIVLTGERVEPVPPVASEPTGESVFFDLAVSYPDDASLAEAETREGICLPRGVVRLREEPIFCWVRLERDDAGNLSPRDPLKTEIETSLRIVLARVEVLDCRLKQPLSLAPRKSARPPTQPYVACGHAIVDWQVWEPPPPDPGPVPLVLGSVGFDLHWTGRVDTSSAGFGTVPCYTARVDGERLFEVGSNHTEALADLRLFVLKSAPDFFDVHLWAAFTMFGGNPLLDPAPPWPKAWSVVWIGVE